MVQEPNWPEYAKIVHDWIQKAYARVYNYQNQMNDNQSKVGMISLFCLLSAHDYMEIAFFSFHKKLFHPGRACLRPIAEMAITFMWCIYKVDDYIERFSRWMKDTIDKKKKLYEHLELWVLDESDTNSLQAQKKDFEEWHKNLFGDINNNLPPVLNMLAELEKRGNDDICFRAIYPMLFSSLCSSSHGILEPDRYFEPKDENIDRRKHAPMPPDTPWVSLTSVLYLIVAIYTFFEWEYSEFMKEYRIIQGIPNP